MAADLSAAAAREAIALLRGRIAGEVDDSTRRRAEYSSDASNYRVVPAAVVFPRSADDVVAVVQTARETSVPLTARGGGTSVAGNAIGPGLVLDFSRHLNRVLTLDADARTVVVEPGVVLDDLQRRVGSAGLRFGPDPSSSGRCTLGGMIGNNACGPRALAYGRTADSVTSLDVIDGHGRRFTAGAGLDAVPGLAEFTRRQLGTIRTELGRFGRQGSGYALEQLLPERGSNTARALVGSEGSCAILLAATLQLTSRPAATALVVLGFPDLPAAAEASYALPRADVTAIEALEAGLLDPTGLPPGAAWLLVETRGDDQAQALAAANRLRGRAGVVVQGAAATRLWRARAAGAGRAGRTPAGAAAWPGWEDAAVPPAQLAGYLREMTALKATHRITGLSYGHFGDGCVHTRLDLPVQDPARLRSFLQAAAALVAAHGGSLSGEHGDGRARSELLPAMYSPTALRAFAEFKALFDPDGLLNPGVLVGPAALSTDLRLGRPIALWPITELRLGGDGADLATAVHRCVGLGTCRATDSGVMCPSFRATRDEKDSTRGRARVLQEMITGELIRDGARSAEVAESLELCLGCKACASECPAGVDVASYKAVVLSQRYRRRLRPREHYTLGWLPRVLAVLGRMPGAVNAVLAAPGLGALTSRVAGTDPRRPLPALSTPGFRRWWATRLPPPRAAGSPGEQTDTNRVHEHRAAATPPAAVVLWVDTFTDQLASEVAQAAVLLLETAGHRVLVAPRSCCGLTYLSTGQLGLARRTLRRTVAALRPYLDDGSPIVGLEPSCVATLRSDLVNVLSDDPDAARLAARVQTLAEYLTATGYRPPDLTGRHLVVQPHCHQQAVLGFHADRQLLRATGATLTEVGGCCGMAGDFGLRHYDLSVAVAGQALLPALGAHPDAMLLADGFSCRAQAHQLSPQTRRTHLAALLASAHTSTDADQARDSGGPPGPQPHQP